MNASLTITKNSSLLPTKWEKEQLHYRSTIPKLNIELLMAIIESRQKTLLQRMEFDGDFKQTFPIDDDGDDHDGSDEEPGNFDNNDQRYWNNRATLI